MQVPYCDLRLQHRFLASDIENAIRRVFEQSSFILGQEVAAFEQAFARYCGVNYAIGTSSGATALIVALKALGVRAGDEVIVPAMTFFATGEAVALLGAKPVFVDIDPRTHGIDAGRIRDCLSSRTRAILPVHLYGHPASMEEITAIAREHNVKVLSDCAHAHGATFHGVNVGALGDAAAFSFYPSKNLGAPGEGGIITTSDPDVAEQCRRFRDHGSVKKFVHTCIGLNARMSGLTAAVLAVKLPYLDEWNEQRRVLARGYTDQMSDLPVTLPHEQAQCTHVYHVYQLGIARRDEVMHYLGEQGIATTMHYPVPMHMHEGFAELGYRGGDFPRAETLAEHTLSIPCYPGMSPDQQQYVVENIRAAARSLLVPSSGQ